MQKYAAEFWWAQKLARTLTALPRPAKPSLTTEPPEQLLSAGGSIVDPGSVRHELRDHSADPLLSGWHTVTARSNLRE
jgi:hypothetical protein